MDYKHFKFKGNIADLSDESKLKEVAAIINAIDHKNWQQYRDAQERLKSVCAVIASIFGSSHAASKYVKRLKPLAPPDHRKEWKRILRQLQQWEEAEAKREKSRDYRRRSKEAWRLLEDLGYVAGEHFKPTSAITYVKKHLAEVEPGVYVPLLDSGQEG